MDLSGVLSMPRQTQSNQWTANDIRMCLNSQKGPVQYSGVVVSSTNKNWCVLVDSHPPNLNEDLKKGHLCSVSDPSLCAAVVSDLQILKKLYCLSKKRMSKQNWFLFSVMVKVLKGPVSGISSQWLGSKKLARGVLHSHIHLISKILMHFLFFSVQKFK